jgi:threonine-phosphate decarboxylase
MSVNPEHGGRVFAAARSLGIAPAEILDFSASINPLGPAPGVREAFCGSFDRVGHYPDREMTELRESLGLRHSLPAEQIVPGNGSTELIYLIPRLLAPRRALIIAPAFSEYAGALRRDRVPFDHLVLSPQDCFALSLDRIAVELSKGYDLLFLANPGNPTGRAYTDTEATKLADICRAAGTFLVLDEAFVDFCEENSVVRLAAERDDLLVLRSMTKFFAIPGIRVGYAVASEETSRRLRSIQEPWSVSTPAQEVAVASLADPDYPRRTLEYVARERESLFAGIAALPLLRPFPSSANYLLIEIPSGTDASSLAEVLLQEERILIRDCSNFAGLDSRFFRVAVRTSDENSRLLSALRRFC